MIKAASLYYAIIFMLLIGILLSGLLLYSGSHRIFVNRLEAENELIDFNESSIAFALEYYKKLDSTPYIEKPFDDNFILATKKEKYGVLDLLFCKSYFHNDTITRKAIVGTTVSKNLALFLADNDKSLYLFNTKLIGNCFLPKKNYSKLQISNNSYGTNIVKGNIMASPKKIPKIDEIFNFDFHQYIKTTYSELPPNSSYSNSFSRNGVMIVMNDKIDFDNISLSGKYIIKAYDSISIKKNAKLNNIIIQSPKIHIENGFVGSVQLIASKSIWIDKNVKLKSPSFLLLKNSTKFKETYVNIDESTIIDGGIVLYGKTDDINTNNLTINKGALVRGTVYCNGSIQLKGKVLGSVYTNNFFLDTGTSKYNNAIKDASIKALPTDFTFINLNFLNSKKYKIIQWLD